MQSSIRAKNMKSLFVLLVTLSMMYNYSLAMNNTTKASTLRTQSKDKTSYGYKRLRTLIGYFKFENNECQTFDFPGKIGTCYAESECVEMGGIPSGPCANGFGVCCFFLYTECGKSSDKNRTYWSNPGGNLGFDQATNCQFTIDKASDNICQIKLDFDVFDIRRPHNGDCDDDRFTVSGQNINSHVPGLCGLNTFQHVYMDVSSSNGPIIMTMTTIGSYKRKWLIKISQIACRSDNLAPSGCLQYYQGPTGIFESFNYEEDGHNRGSFKGYLNDLDYSMCFRKELGACGISIQKEPIKRPSFHIDSAITAAAAGHIECPKDYLIFNSIRLCGIHVNDDLTGNPTVDSIITENTNGPFLAKFRSDSSITHRGFKLMFRQNPCDG